MPLEAYATSCRKGVAIVFWSSLTVSAQDCFSCERSCTSVRDASQSARFFVTETRAKTFSIAVAICMAELNRSCFFSDRALFLTGHAERCGQLSQYCKRSACFSRDIESISQERIVPNNLSPDRCVIPNFRQSYSEPLHIPLLAKNKPAGRTKGTRKNSMTFPRPISELYELIALNHYLFFNLGLLGIIILTIIDTSGPSFIMGHTNRNISATHSA